MIVSQKDSSKNIMVAAGLSVLFAVALAWRMGIYKDTRDNKKKEFLKQKATLIDKGAPYRYGSNVYRDVYVSTDDDLKTTEGIVEVRLNERPANNAAIRDMTNGTALTIEKWKEFGRFQSVR